jgi:ribosome biogenesis protein SLX9
MLKHARLLESRSTSPGPLFLNLILLQEVEASRQPYSKSHARRLRRKAKEELAGGALSDIQLAIATMESDDKTLAGNTLAEPLKRDPSKPPAKTPTTGLIGEGSSTPLSQTKRKNALYVSTPDSRIVLIPCVRKLERIRHPMIIANSDFKANPFHAIRTHATNTLVKNTPAQSS